MGTRQTPYLLRKRRRQIKERVAHLRTWLGTCRIGWLAWHTNMWESSLRRGSSTERGPWSVHYAQGTDSPMSLHAHAVAPRTGPPRKHLPGPPPARPCAAARPATNAAGKARRRPNASPLTPSHFRTDCLPGDEKFLFVKDIASSQAEVEHTDWNTVRILGISMAFVDRAFHRSRGAWQHLRYLGKTCWYQRIITFIVSRHAYITNESFSSP